jgi:HD-like signal output (HDOD) protein
MTNTLASPASSAGVLASAETIKASGQILARLNQALQNPVTVLSDIGQILRCDVALSARVVRIANGAFFFASKSPVKSIEEALQRVGLREVARLVATATMQGMAGKNLRAYGISGPSFLRASIFSASASQALAREMHLDEGAAYLAGLIRPIGILALNHWAEQTLPSPDLLPWDDEQDLMAWEQRHFGLPHVEASAYIARKWSFAPAICGAIETFAHLGPETENYGPPLGLCL